MRKSWRSIAKLGGFLGPILAVLKLPPVSKPLNFLISSFITVSLTIYFSPDIVRYFSQPFNITDTFLISRDYDFNRFMLLKQRTATDVYVDGYTCVNNGMMSPAFSYTFRQQEESIKIIENGRFIAGSDVVFIVLNIYVQGDNFGLVEWWDLSASRRLSSLAQDKRFNNCEEVRDAIRNE